MNKQSIGRCHIHSNFIGRSKRWKYSNRKDGVRKMNRSQLVSNKASNKHRYHNFLIHRKYLRLCHKLGYDEHERSSNNNKKSSPRLCKQKKENCMIIYRFGKYFSPPLQGLQWSEKPTERVGGVRVRQMGIRTIFTPHHQLFSWQSKNLSGWSLFQTAISTYYHKSLFGILLMMVFFSRWIRRITQMSWNKQTTPFHNIFFFFLISLFSRWVQWEFPHKNVGSNW